MPKKSKKISRETMLALGFTESWPQGNVTEPYWEYPFKFGKEIIKIRFWGFPTVEDFWKEISDTFMFEGREEVRDLFRQAMGE